MSNSFDVLIGKILARGLMALREQCIMPQLVNGDYASEGAMYGQTIDVPVSRAVTAVDITPSNTPPALVDTTVDKVQISLDKWKGRSFSLTDKEMLEIDANRDFFPLAAMEAIRAIANGINSDIFSEYKGVYGYVGTAGTTPFASAATAAIDARKMLHSQLCPRSDRRGVLNFDAEANALGLATFADAEKVGDASVKRTGEMGRLYGIDWFTDDIVPTHTAGTPGGTPLVNGALSAGVTSVAIDGMGTGSYLKGDIISFAGHSQTYVVLADAAASSNAATVTFAPALKSAVADNAAVTLRASHVVNLAFHRDAFAFVNRPLRMDGIPAELMGGRAAATNVIARQTMRDPKTGIAMRLEVAERYKAVSWEFDVLYGKKLVRPEFAVRIAG